MNIYVRGDDFTVDDGDGPPRPYPPWTTEVQLSLSKACCLAFCAVPFGNQGHDHEHNCSSQARYCPSTGVDGYISSFPSYLPSMTMKRRNSWKESQVFLESQVHSRSQVLAMLLPKDLCLLIVSFEADFFCNVLR